MSVPDAVVREVDRAIRERRPGPLLLWTYVHIDPYIHEHGYDGAVLRCLTALSRAAHRWSAAGFTVIAHSDHGMVETTSPPELVAMFDEVTGSPSCRLPPGGAGRVRWAYPRHGRSDEVLDRLSDGLGDRAWVGRAGDLDKMRVLPLSPLLRERVGEVVAVASGREFPLPEPKPHEHGGLTPEEMIVPLAVWEGR